jgi:hypothetical protein
MDFGTLHGCARPQAGIGASPGPRSGYLEGVVWPADVPDPKLADAFSLTIYGKISADLLFTVALVRSETKANVPRQGSRRRVTYDQVTENTSLISLTCPLPAI